MRSSYSSSRPSTAESLTFDLSKFPSLPTQKALIMIDFQNDFVSEGGALVTSHNNASLVERAARLAEGFRDLGLVIWVQSQFDKPRRFVEGQQIITKTMDIASMSIDRRAKPEELSPEAFLSSKESECVRRGTAGWQLAAPLKKIVNPARDMVLMKTHYSAFEGTKLLQILRSKLVTSLYICGSLINVGVHATTVDAAAHGYSIVLVRDCCGWSDRLRCKAAIANLVEVSGCEVVKGKSVVESVPVSESASESEDGVAGGEDEEKDEEEPKKEARITQKKGKREIDVKNYKGKERGKTEIQSQWKVKEGERPQSNASKFLAALAPLEPDEEPTIDRSDMLSLEAIRNKYSRSRAIPAQTPPAADSIIAVDPNNDYFDEDDDSASQEAKEILAKWARAKKDRYRHRHRAEQSRSPERVKMNVKMENLSLSSPPRKSGAAAAGSSNSPDADGGSPSGGGCAAPAGVELIGANPGRVRSKRQIQAPSQESTHNKERPKDAGKSTKVLEDDAGKIKSDAPGGSSPKIATSIKSDPIIPQDTKTDSKQPQSKMTAKSPKTDSPQVAGKPAPPAGDAPNKMTAKTEPPQEADKPVAPAASPPDETPAAPQESEPLCEGDTKVIYNVLPPDLEEGIFDKLKEEVDWQRMSHLGGEVPRLVAVQGTVGEDGSVPVYRHPSDESPPLRAFSPTALKLKEEVEKHLGHTLNHALIQYYRDGKDYISEHSDKTLDIVRGTYIANLSLGAERTMVFRTKRADKDGPKPADEKETAPPPPETGPATTGKGRHGASPPSPHARQVQRAKLPHNSLCRLGPRSNMRWLHAIKQDKRPDFEKTAEERAFAGGRISLTFRNIGTFLDKEETIIWGQGATCKTRDGAGPVVSGDEAESLRMVKAFGVENRASEFDWDGVYGGGFDVLHMTKPE